MRARKSVSMPFNGLVSFLHVLYIEKIHKEVCVNAL